MRGPDGKYITVTIRRVWSAASATGDTSLVLETRELGTIAFVVPPEAIPLLRKQLADIEALQARGTGSA